MRKLDIGHYAFALKTEVQGGVQLSLSASCAKFTTDTQARVILSEQLKQDGSINFPMYTGATFESNFSLASGGAQLLQLEHHEYSNWRFGCGNRRSCAIRSLKMISSLRQARNKHRKS